MAKRRKVMKTPQEKPEQFRLVLRPNQHVAFPSFYSNFASVSHTPTEICIDFCIAAQPFQVDIQKKTASIPVVARILVPPGMADGLVKALQQQILKQKDDPKIFKIPVEKTPNQ